ncbi:MAG: MarR family winged helix-turn-helix transcriptional regulator [Vulcanimicrobiaceae bacterium]
MRRPSKNPSIEECADAGYPNALLGCPDFILSTLGYLVSGLIEDALQPFGLRMRHYRLLRILYADGPQRQNAIGAQLGIDRTSVVGLIDNLEKMGLAKRERSTQDRRAYLVKLTPKGRKTIVKAIERLSETEQAMFRPLGSSEKSELQRLATQLLAQSGPIAEQHQRESAALLDRSAESGR